tara:strand:+ start:1017 stop:1652 length:636 start_codon:yes stop_codon:yes gene_type:complete
MIDLDKVKVSTMTVIYRRLCEAIDLELLSAHINTNVYGMAIVEKEKGKKVFKNQILVSYPQEERNVKVKVFHNGTLHFTGLNSLNMAKCIVSLFRKINMELNPNQETYETGDYQIVMMNMVSEAKYHIHQDKLKDLFISKYNMFATFEPKTYAGINCKYSVNNTIIGSLLIFQSGRYIISGCKSMELLMKCKEFMTHVLDQERHLIELKSN